MKYWNSTLRSMTEYVPGEQPHNIEEYIKLNTNESPFPPSDEVIAAIRAKTGAALRLYPDQNCEDLCEACAEVFGLKKSNIFIGNGSDEIFTILFRGFIEKDAKALFMYPSYSLYYTMAEANGIAYDTVDLDDDFSFNIKNFKADGYALAILCSPNNPTGRAIELSQIEKFVSTFKGLVCVDEAYVDFCGKSAIQLVKSHDNLIVTRSFSKSYSLAGMRIGVAAACDDIIKGFYRLKDSYNVDMLSQSAAVAAIKDQKSLQYRVRMICDNRDYLSERLSALDFFVVPSDSNFVLTKHKSVPSVKLYEGLKERKILVRHFKSRIINEYLRISIGSMKEMKELVSAIEEIIVQNECV